MRVFCGVAWSEQHRTGWPQLRGSDASPSPGSHDTALADQAQGGSTSQALEQAKVGAERAKTRRTLPPAVLYGSPTRLPPTREECALVARDDGPYEPVGRSGHG